jgi:hypothetical protein
MLYYVVVCNLRLEGVSFDVALDGVVHNASRRVLHFVVVLKASP